MLIPYCLFIRLLRITIDKVTRDYFMSKYIGKYHGEELERKFKKCSRGVFKVIHFGYMFILGWLVLRETPFHSPLLFGSGNTFMVFGNWPYTPMPYLCKFYYLMSMAYYVEDLIMHVISPPNSDYWEMILHHLIAAMLIFASYANGMWAIGTVVLVQMDVSDIFVGHIRVILDFASNTTIVIVYLGILVTWFYFRFVTYGYIIIYVYGFAGRVSVDNYAELTKVNMVLLYTLFFLNIYWFILLLRMGGRMITKGKAHDLQNVIASKDVKVD